MKYTYKLELATLRLAEPDRPPYRRSSALAYCAHQFDGTTVKLARSTYGVWRLDITRDGWSVTSFVGARGKAGVLRLVDSARASYRARGSELAVCFSCRLPINVANYSELDLATNSLAHAECPDLDFAELPEGAPTNDNARDVTPSC